MNLATAIHARWAASSSLNALLSADQVTSGAHFQSDPAESYATVTLPGGTVEGHANDGSSLVNLLVRILIHHPDCGAGRAVVAAAQTVFNRADLDLGDAGKVLCMRPAALPKETQDPRTGHWQWVLDFECLTHLLQGT